MRLICAASTSSSVASVHTPSSPSSASLGSDSRNQRCWRRMAAAGREVEVKHAPARVGEVQHSCLDTSKLRGLGWEPAVTLHEGLGLTYEHIAAQGVAA